MTLKSFVFRRRIQKVALRRQIGGAGDGGGGVAGAVSQVSSSTMFNLIRTFELWWFKLRPLDLPRTLPQRRQRWRRRGRRGQEEEEVRQLLPDLWWQPVLVCDRRTGKWAGQTQQPIVRLSQHCEEYTQTQVLAFDWSAANAALCLVWEVRGHGRRLRLWQRQLQRGVRGGVHRLRRLQRRRRLAVCRRPGNGHVNPEGPLVIR